MQPSVYPLISIAFVIIVYLAIHKKYRPVLVKHDAVIYFSTQVLGVKTGSEILARLAF